MHTSQFLRQRSWRRLFQTPVLYSILCAGMAASLGALPAPAAEPVPLPSYQPGMTFLYSNGRWETVEAVDVDRITWRNHRGNTSVGSPDFTYRRQEWQTRTRRGTRQIRARRVWLGESDPMSLWPLAVGNKARYIETGRYQDKDGRWRTYMSQWRAEVVGRERIRVLAGEFDTWKIMAYRFSSGTAYTRRSRLREKRTWYFAPAVGHYVRFTKDYLGRKPLNSVDLVSVRPRLNHLESPVKSAIEANFQMALEKKRSGQPLPWKLPGQSASGSTRPTATFRVAGDRYCRQYVQEVRIGQGGNTYFGMACRDPQGQWRLPNL